MACGPSTDILDTGQRKSSGVLCMPVLEVDPIKPQLLREDVYLAIDDA